MSRESWYNYRPVNRGDKQMDGDRQQAVKTGLPLGECCPLGVRPTALRRTNRPAPPLFDSERQDWRSPAHGACWGHPTVCLKLQAKPGADRRPLQCRVLRRHHFDVVGGADFGVAGWCRVGGTAWPCFKEPRGLLEKPFGRSSARGRNRPRRSGAGGDSALGQAP